MPQVVLATLVGLGWLFMSFWAEPLFPLGSPAWLGMTFVVVVLAVVIFYWRALRRFASAVSLVAGLLTFIIVGASLGGVTWLLVRTIPSEVEGVNQTEKQLARLEFLQQRDNAVQQVRFLVRLSQAFTPDELGHFRILLEIIALGEPDPHPTLWVAARDAYPIAHSKGQETKLDGVQTIAWSRHPDESLQKTVVGAAIGPQMSEILAWGTINRRGPFQTIESFDNKWINIFVTESLLSKVAYIGFAIDNYLILGLPIDCLDAKRSKPLVKWPDELSESERAIEWVGLLPKRYWPNDDSRPPLRPPLQIDFNRFTPVKLELSGNLQGWSPITVPDCDLAKVWPP